MNKSDLVTRMSERLTYLDKQDIDASLSCLLEKISETLHKRNRIELRGFGSFSSRERKAHIARNPQTGKAIGVSSKFHPFFRTSLTFKGELNK